RVLFPHTAAPQLSPLSLHERSSDLRPRATEEERRLLSAVTAEAEREGRAVRLMIVPGVNVFDSVIETAVRLESSEIHVGESETLDRKSTRLNSSHVAISYAVFCLKK